MHVFYVFKANWSNSWDFYSCESWFATKVINSSVLNYKEYLNNSFTLIDFFSFEESSQHNILSKFKLFDITEGVTTKRFKDFFRILIERIASLLVVFPLRVFTAQTCLTYKHASGNVEKEKSLENGWAFRGEGAAEKVAPTSEQHRGLSDEPWPEDRTINYDGEFVRFIIPWKRGTREKETGEKMDTRNAVFVVRWFMTIQFLSSHFNLLFLPFL